MGGVGWGGVGHIRRMCGSIGCKQVVGALGRTARASCVPGGGYIQRTHEGVG